MGKKKDKKKKLKKKLNVRKKYKTMQCKFIKKSGKQCKKYACGKSTLCEYHGGNPKDKGALIPVGKISDHQLTLTKFNPAIHPLQYIELSRQGLSKTEIAAKFGVSFNTLSSWCQTYEGMQLASDIGDEQHKAWWLTEGKLNLDNNRYNTGMYKFLTGNIIGFSDKIESKNTNLHVHGVLVAPNKISPAEWQKQMDEDKAKRNAIEAEIVKEEDE